MENDNGLNEMGTVVRTDEQRTRVYQPSVEHLEELLFKETQPTNWRSVGNWSELYRKSPRLYYELLRKKVRNRLFHFATEARNNEYSPTFMSLDFHEAIALSDWLEELLNTAEVEDNGLPF